MADNLDKYGLDLHCRMILEEYCAAVPVFERMRILVKDNLTAQLESNGLYIAAFESRIKAEASLAGKLELKGHKYTSLESITDILGARVITFYSDDVDKISAMVEKTFDIDWDNSVDKRKMHELDSFGYNSLHYICRIPESLFKDPEHPEINQYRFEIQIRTALQHVWATLDHDTGYKSGVAIPKEHLRNLNRLAGMLELVDEQFSIIRTSINDYRRKVQSLVANGKFSDVPLNIDTFKSFLQLRPFDKLTYQIAAINQAEVHESSVIPYLAVLKDLGMETLEDVNSLVQDNSEDAYRYAVFQIGNTDLDIISSTIAIQDLCVVHILKRGGGVEELKHMFDVLGGVSEYNVSRAERIVKTAGQLSFMHK